MTQAANSQLSEYLAVINRYYRTTSFITPMSNDAFLNSLSSELKNAWNEAEIAATKWDCFVSNIRNEPWVQFTRDWKMANRQCYKVIIGIKRDSTITSIVVFVSFIGRKIGFMYIDMDKALVNPYPVYDYSRKPSRVKLVPFASYFPLNGLHETLSSQILAGLIEVFPDFTLFDNQFADYKVEAIQTEEDDFYHIDLFMVFFERGLPAGIPT